MSDQKPGTGEPDLDKLDREIDAPMLAIYGAGTILGAGIYVLIGKVIGEAGLWTPVAFLVAAVVAAVNGLVYAELATRSPRAGGPTDYIEKAFGRRWFTIMIGWMIVTTGVVSAATITTGFSGYLKQFVDVPEWIPRVGLLAVLGGVAALGAKESAWFMAVTTTLGVIGLLFVLYVGFFDNGGGNGVPDWSAYLSEAPSFSDAAVWAGVLSAAFLAVYAFIGFEDIVHMAEEVKDPSRSIPFAIVVALAVAAVLYVAVSLAALFVMNAEELAKSEAPLIAVVEKAGYPGWPLGVLGLWIILNGALAQIVMASRVIYGLREHRGAPSFLVRINPKTRTPIVATAGVVLVIMILALFLPLKTLASVTSLVMLLVFAASNGALIILERRDPDAPFDVPTILPWMGLTISLLLVAGKFIFGGGGH